MYDVNYAAVVFAAVANMAVGTLWYGPVFGKMWKGYMGFTNDGMKKMPLNAFQAMIGGSVVALLMAYMLAQIAQGFLVESVADAIKLGFWMWLGFAVPFTSGSFLWEGRPVGLFVLNASQWLVSLLAMSFIVTLWGSVV